VEANRCKFNLLDGFLRTAAEFDELKMCETDTQQVSETSKGIGTENMSGITAVCEISEPQLALAKTAREIEELRLNFYM
jgi:hypothetical protein